jgi:urease accessory protein
MSTDGPVLTRLDVQRDRIELKPGLLRAQQVRGRDGTPRVGLVATTALLLGGDTVEIEVRVGPGASLEIFDVAGTVAYDGRGMPAEWHVRITVGAGSKLVWHGQPFVVADGADVDRTLRIDLEATASMVLRETLVLGRTRQRGGRIRNCTEISAAGTPVLLEDQLLDPDGTRTLPGVLGDHRIVDTVIALGDEAAPIAVPAPAVSFTLPSGAGTMIRYVGHEFAESPLHDQMVLAAITDLTASRPPDPPEVR